MENEDKGYLPKLSISSAIKDSETNIDIDDLSDDFWHFMLSKRRLLMFIGFPLAFIWAVVCLLGILIYLRLRDINEYVLYIAFAPLSMMMASFAAVKFQFRDSFYEQFASLNKMEFHRLGHGVVVSKLGTIFDIYPDYVIKDAVCGQFMKRNMNMYVCLSNKWHATAVTVIEINIRDLLPNVLLVSKKSKIAGPLSRSFKANRQSHSFTLEGNFNDYFNLYGNEDCNIEILQIFSPTFMQLLIDSSLEYSVEFAGLTVFIYSNKVITKRSQLSEMLNNAKVLTENIVPISSRMYDEDILAMNPIVLK